MRDRLGQVWLLGILVFIAGLSVWLWVSGRQSAPQASEDYSIYEASRLLECTPYVLNKGIALDINRDGVQEYLISCDSSLMREHRHFVLFQIRRKKVEVLLQFREGTWVVGAGPAVRSGYWVVDRRRQEMLFVDREDVYYRLLWKDRHIELIAE